MTDKITIVPAEISYTMEIIERETVLTYEPPWSDQQLYGENEWSVYGLAPLR